MSHSSTFTNSKKVNKLAVLVEQFCEIVFLQKDAKQLAPICRNDITFYSNITLELGHGIASLEKFQKHENVQVISAYPIEYELMDTTVDSEGNGQVVLKACFCAHSKFHIIADITSDPTNENTQEENNKLLISRIHIFHEPNIVDVNTQNTGMSDTGRQHGSHACNQHADSCEINCSLPNDNGIFSPQDAICGVIQCYVEEGFPIVHIDDRMLDYLGYKDAEEVKSLGSGVDFLHPDDVERKVRDFKEQLKNGTDFALEFRLRKKNDMYIWVSASGTLIPNTEKREILNIVCVDMKKQHAMLVHATNEVSQLYNNIPGAIMRCALDEDGAVEFANDGFYELIDYTREEFAELYANKMSRITHPDDVARMQELVGYAVAHMTTVSLEHRIISKNAAQKWVGVHASIVVDENGKSSLYCACSDITERYEMLAALTFAKDKMEAAIQHTGLRYWDYYPTLGSAHIPENLGRQQEAEDIDNFPESVIESGAINENSIDVFRSLHARIKSGEAYVEGTILATHDKNGKEEWRKMCYTNVYDGEGYPTVAIGTSENIDAYKEIERRLTIAATQTGIDIWTYNIDSKIITQEDNVATIGLGERYFENVPDAVIESGIIYEDDIEAYRDVYRQLEAGALQVGCDLRVKSTGTDNFTWTRLSYTVLPNGESAKTALGIALDISEQKLAETYYENEIQLWNLGVSDATMACIINLSSNTVLNGKADESLGISLVNCTAQELFALFLSSIVSVDEKQYYAETFTVENLLHQFKIGTRLNSLELEIRLGNLESIWVSLTLNTMKNPVTDNIIAFMTMKDITETKISQKFVEELVNHQFDFILRLNFVANTYKLFASTPIRATLNNIECNGAYNEDIAKLLTGTVVEEDLSLVLQEAKVERILERSEKEGDYYVLFRAKREGSADRYKRIHIFLRDEATHSICIGCVDITEMHLQEQQHVETLRAALTIAKQANESKGLFLASMSHDIRTPMNAIIGMTNLAIEDQENPTQVTESLSVIKSSSEHLLALLNDILEMSRLESGKVVFSKESFSISYECGQVYNFFKGIVIQKEQKIHFECNNIKHDQVISDVTRFNRVLTNLLGNAVKFTPNGGEISMLVEELEMENEKTAVFRIAIKDSGIGIAKEHLGSIFEAFNREEKSTVKQIEGTGLGLAIVKSLVDGQGGSINVESDTGKGATFTVELPMTIDEEIIEKTVYDIPKLQMSDVDLKSQHILLVEDHPINVIVATKMLEKMGAVISVANNGQEGYEIFSNSPEGTFKLVLMDLQMPIMNGHEATIAIRNCEHPEAKTIPIVAMTANAFAEDVRSCKASGMNCHIAKPITVENILNCLTQLHLL